MEGRVGHRSGPRSWHRPSPSAIDSNVKIIGDRSICIGAAVCSLTAPAVFEQDRQEGLVVVLDERPTDADLAAAMDAVELCPSGALSLIEHELADDV
jgi:ferredoxin